MASESTPLNSMAASSRQESRRHAGQTQSEKAAVTAPDLGPARGIFWGLLFSLCTWPLLFGLALFIFG